MKPKEKPELKFHDKSCFDCRYLCYHVTEHSHSSCCLLLGRDLAIGSVFDGYSLRARYCDGFKKRPKTWQITSSESPYWEDKYIPRKMQQNLRTWVPKWERVRDELHDAKEDGWK